MDELDYWSSEEGAAKEFTTDFQMDLFARYVPADSRVLDVGCGYGRVLAQLAAHGYRSLVGVDVSPALIARGKAMNPRLNIRVQREPGVLDIAEESFDAGLLCAVLTCIPDDRAQEQLVDEIYRVLRPGGTFYCCDFLLNDDARNVARYHEFEPEFGTYGIFKLDDGAVLRHHEEHRIQSLLNPFRTLLWEETTFRTMNGHTSRGFVYIGRRE